MSIEGLIVSLVLVALAVLAVVLPLLRPESRPAEMDAIQIEKQRERLLVYYERVLTNLRDLDEDHATGKMPDADYAAEREDWMLRGIAVLRALDELQDHSIIQTAVRDDAALDEAIDSAIEQAIQARREQQALEYTR